MARVKDTGPKGGSAPIPAAGRKASASSGAKAEVSESKATSTSKKTKAKKNVEAEVKPNETGHPIGVETTQAKSPKDTKRKGKKNDEASTEDITEKKSKKDKKTKAVDAKPIESTMKKVVKDTVDGAKDVVTEVKARASKAKKELEAEAVKQGKRKSTAAADDAEEKPSKKSKKTQSEPIAEKSSRKPSKKETKADKDTEASKSNTSKGKKRKAVEDEVTPKDTAPPDTATVKKQKKSATKKGPTLVDQIKSGLESVTDAITGGQTSIVEDVANLAEDAVQSKPKGSRSATKSRKSAKSAIEPTESEIEAEAASTSVDATGKEDDEDEWQPEDEIAQLITGFESEGEDEESGNEGFSQGKAIPKLPKQKALTTGEKSGKSSGGPGVIYIGRVPHGFHEHEMRAYFSQFGDVNHVRLSRSKKTGKSKHYAFLEFRSEEVAKIAAKTMDKYLLFGHILRCSFVPKEQVHSSLWKGADKRFKSVPWAKIEGRKLAAPKGRSQWQKKVEKETKKRTSKADKLKELGYDFEPTELKSVDSVPVQAQKQLEDGVTEEEKTIVVGRDGNSITVSEEVKTKKVKKAKKATKTDATAVEAIEGGEVQANPEDGKRVKKPSKRAMEATEDIAGRRHQRRAERASDWNDVQRVCD